MGPLNERVESYLCTHAIGHSLLRSEKDGVRAEWRLFVPTDLTGECWTLWLYFTASNRGPMKKSPAALISGTQSLSGR
ncbi:MAG: hypothetical protein IIY43_00080 [Oscillospiraceae bacterium]|nr:hypothetical protein [Oscillospiraceae bacterium]